MTGMESCCTTGGDEPVDQRRCVECGRPGRAVDLVTLKALLRPASLESLSAGEHAFCASPGCDVVYFGEGGVYRRDDVAVPVFQKEPVGRRTVCYCFDVGEDVIRREVESDGVSASAERIKRLVRDERCACELRNPQGSCCLGNVTAVIRSLAALAVP